MRASTPAIAIAALFALLPVEATAQTLLQRFLATVQVRQSFAAAALQGKPASISWTSQDEPEESDYATIDVAVRYPFQVAVGVGSLIAGPTAEWHKLTQESKAADKVSLGGSSELVVTAVKLPWLGSPYATADLAFERDRELDKSGTNYSAAFTLFSTARFAPGHPTALWPNSMLRYYPWVGIERFANVTDSISAVRTGFIKATVEFWPFSRVQALGSYSWISEFGDRQLTGNLDRRSASLNVYLDSAAHFAIGIEHIDGSVPKEAFTQAERTIFGLKIKF